MESDPEDVINLSSKPGDLLKVSYNGEDGKKIEMEFMDGTLAKAGARHSKADSERIQGIHDHAAGLGADCSSVKVASADDLQKVHDETIAKMAVVEADLTKLQGENDDLKKAMEAKEARIKELEKEPAEPKGIQKAVVVEKSQDSQVLSGDIPEDIRKLAEKVEKQEARPDDVLKVILKHGGRAQ
jgi:undecaprenyl pyrophosphate synthase